MGGKAKGEGARSWKVKMKKILGISVKGEGEWHRKKKKTSRIRKFLLFFTEGL